MPTSLPHSEPAQSPGLPSAPTHTLTHVAQGYQAVPSQWDGRRGTGAVVQLHVPAAHPSPSPTYTDAQTVGEAVNVPPGGQDPTLSSAP